MRYIHKGAEPKYITEYKKSQLSGNLAANYANFREKRRLNDDLRMEQRHICCYCQQSLDHFQTPLTKGAHNEHLIPQQLDPGDGSIDMNYDNIYACCIDSRGMGKLQRHCGEAKGDCTLKGFIKDPNCRKYFKYNLLGEILPNGEYSKWSDYVDKESLLSDIVKDAYNEISILNLNCVYLVNERKKDIFAIVKSIISMSGKEISEHIKRIEQSDTLPRFADMQLYYMYNRLKFCQG